MTATTNEITPLKKIFLLGETFSWKTYLISAIAVCLFFALAYKFGMELYALFAITGSLCLWLMLHYPKIWIYCVVLGCSIFLKQSEEGIDAADIFAAVLLNLFLIVWLFGKISVKLEKIAVTSAKELKFKDTLTITSLSEKLFILFYFFLLFNSFIAHLNGVPMFDWIREYILYTLILYCFPIIEYIRTKRDCVTLLLLLGLVSLFLDLKQFYNCYLVFKNITYAFQLGGTIRANQGFYSSIVVSGIVFFFFAKKKKSKIFALVVVMFSTVAIITTFSRSFWGAIIICTFLFLFFLNYKQVLQLFLIILLSLGIMSVSINTFLPQQSAFLQKFIVKRFTSTTQGRKDISIRVRIDETKVVLAKIKESPITGYGLRSEYSKYFSISQTTVTHSFIHNGYLSLAHKAGIPMSVLFHITMFLFTIRGLCNAWKLKRQLCYVDKDSDLPFYLAMSICATLTLVLYFITNFTGTTFYVRDGSIPTAISIAFIHIAEQKLKNATTKKLAAKTQE